MVKKYKVYKKWDRGTIYPRICSQPEWRICLRRWTEKNCNKYKQRIHLTLAIHRRHSPNGEIAREAVTHAGRPNNRLATHWSRICWIWVKPNLWCEHIDPRPIGVNRHLLEIVPEYTYLGQILQLGRNKFEKKVKGRIQLG